MTEDEILAIFREHSALLEGHFILSSGLHSDRYIQCALVLQHPRIAEQLCSELGGKLRHLGAKVVAAPALGGVIVAHEVARALNVRAVFTERQDKVMRARDTQTLHDARHSRISQDPLRCNEYPKKRQHRTQAQPVEHALQDVPEPEYALDRHHARLGGCRQPGPCAGYQHREGNEC